MHTLRSDSGLLQLDYRDTSLTAHSLPVPWQHPLLRTRLLKVALLLALACATALLEKTAILSTQWPGLFPLLLLIGALFQVLQLNAVRRYTFRLELTPAMVTLHTGQSTDEPGLSLPRTELPNVFVIREALGRQSTQAVLGLGPSGAQCRLRCGGGLPEDDLNWLREHLQNWLREV
jgi:hypothetical protein